MPYSPVVILKENHARHPALAAVFHRDLSVDGHASRKRDRKVPNAAIEQKFFTLTGDRNRSRIRCPRCVVTIRATLDWESGRDAWLNLDVPPFDRPGQIPQRRVHPRKFAASKRMEPSAPLFWSTSYFACGYHSV